MSKRVLYKFRSLGNDDDLKRVQHILNTCEFWCSKFWELNDPMEGVYSFQDGALTDEFITGLYGAKSEHVICSFSGEKAFRNPIMWGYYANGFKGIAIKLEVDDSVENITKMRYKQKVANVRKRDDKTVTVKDILTTKLTCWKNEDESRFITTGKSGYHKIDTITAVYFGNPYRTTKNSQDVMQHDVMEKYIHQVKSIKKVAVSQGYTCHDVDVQDRIVVEIEPNGQEAQSS